MQELITLTETELSAHIQQLLEWEALEICPEKETGQVQIPYVMNDAVEQYITLQNCRILGEWQEKTPVTEVESVKNGDSWGLILHQGMDNIVTLWFEGATITTGLYQYHRIGHAWRKIPGEEYMRRLVNLLCVIHDKCHYLEEKYWTLQEKELAELAEFPPVLFYTPIHESIQDWYPASLEGILSMEKILKECGNMSLQKQLLKYKTLFMKGKIKEKHIRQFAKQLLERENQGIWSRISQKIEEASGKLPLRDYGEDRNNAISNLRNQVEKKYLKEGYQGHYPVLCREDGHSVEFVEEHPFTVMEEENYSFKIFSMSRLDGDISKIEWKREEDEE